MSVRESLYAALYCIDGIEPQVNAPVQDADPIKKDVARAEFSKDAKGPGGGDSLQKTLAEHAAVCEAKSPETCPYTRKMAKEIAASKGISMEEAMAEAAAAHTSASQQTKLGQQPQHQNANAQQPLQQPEQPIPPPQPLDAETAEAEVAQLTHDPETILTAESKEIKPEVVSTPVGDVPVESTVQKATIEALVDNGSTEALDTISKIADKVEEGEAKEEENASQEGLQEEQADNPEQKPQQETTKQPYALTDEEKEYYKASIANGGVVTFYNNVPGEAEKIAALRKEGILDGLQEQKTNYGVQFVKKSKIPSNKGNDSLDPHNWDDEKLAAVIQENKEKLTAYEPGSAMHNFYKAKVESYEDLQRERESKKSKEAHEPSSDGGTAPISGETSSHSEVSSESESSPSSEPPGSKPPTSREPLSSSEPSSEGAPPPEGGTPPSGETPAESAPDSGESKEESEPTSPEPSSSTSTYAPPSSPSDSIYQIGPNTYQVGDKVYRDISQMGLIRAMYHAFIAGLKGETLITGMDRISGTWDAIKRSESGESLRDGIANSLILNEFASLKGTEGLDMEAKAELDEIERMYSDPDATPQQRMKAIEKLREWKDKNIEKGEGDADGIGGDLSDLDTKDGSTWKTPRPDIFKEVSSDERDTSFMEEKKQQIEERLKSAGIDANIVNAINGSSVVQFDIQRGADGTDKRLQDVLKAMEPDIGVKINYTPDTTSGKERMGRVTINNPTVRDAGIRRLVEQEDELAKARKMACPMLVGETAEGKAYWMDMSEHGFVGGDSGSGKSERAKGMLAGLYYAKSPEEVQVMVNCHANAADFAHLEGDPHTARIGTTVEAVAENLRAANAEWKRRQKIFAEAGCKNLKEYNEKMKAEGKKGLPQILVVTDEVTNLLAQRPDLTDEIRGIITNGRKFGVAHMGLTQDLMAKNVPTDLKGAQRLGVKSLKKYASDAIFDTHNNELGKLNGKGDIMVRGADGNLIRLRGTYADEENLNRLREFGTGKMTLKDLPEFTEEEKEGIKRAIAEGVSIEINQTEGLEDQFRKKFPEGWTITEGVDAEGTKTWKATPPAPKTEAETPTEEEKASESEKSDFDPSSRESILGYALKQKESKKAKALEEFQKHKDIDKFNKELDKIDEEERQWQDLADRLHPENLADGEATTEAPTGEEGATDTAEADGAEVKEDAHGNQIPSEPQEVQQEGKEEWESPLAKSQTKEARISDARGVYDRGASELRKKFEKGKITQREYNQGMKDLDKAYQQRMEDINKGMSDDEINERDDKEAKSRKDKNDALKKSVVTQWKGKPVAGSVHITKSRGATFSPMPKVTLQKAKENLPEGFEIDTDENGTPLVNGSGFGWARNPENGSYGWIDKGGEFHMSVNTSDPRYKGRNSPEAQSKDKEIKAANRKLAEGETDEATVERLQKEYRNIAYGTDKAPLDVNRFILAEAISSALSGDKMSPVVY